MSQPEGESPPIGLNKKYFSDFIDRIRQDKEKGVISQERLEKLAGITNSFPELKVSIKEIDEITQKESLSFTDDIYLGMLTQLRREIHEAKTTKSISSRQAKEFLKQLGLKEVKPVGTEKRVQRGRGKKGR